MRSYLKAPPLGGKSPAWSAYPPTDSQGFPPIRRELDQVTDDLSDDGEQITMLKNRVKGVEAGLTQVDKELKALQTTLEAMKEGRRNPGTGAHASEGNYADWQWHNPSCGL